MKRWVRGIELVQGILLVLGLIAPLALFFFRVKPWSLDIPAFFRQPSTVQSISSSLVLALTTSVLSTGLAFLFSWLLWRFEWPARPAKTLALTLKIPYFLPAFFLAMGWIALAAPSVGHLNRAFAAIGLPGLPSVYGLGGAIFVETLWTTALAMIQLQPFFGQFPGQLEDAAVLCGASPMETFFKITLPLARIQLMSCAMLTGVSALAAFGVPAMLASPARSFVLTTRIFQATKGGTDFAPAGLLSLILLGITVTLLAAQKLISRPQTMILVGGKASRPTLLAPGLGAKMLFGAAAAFALISCVLPYGAITLQALLRDPSDVTSLSLDKFRYVFTQAPDGLIALGNSALTSVGGAVLATVLGLFTAYGSARLQSRPSKLITGIWGIGYALPGTVIALSLLVFFSGSITDTLWILLLAYFVKYASFALRTLTPAIGALGKELEEAAWMSGASEPCAFFSVLLPILAPAVSAALLLALVPMFSELTMSVLLVGTGTETLGAMIYRLQEYADPGSASVLAIVVATAILILRRLL